MANNREDMVAMVQAVGPQLLRVLDNNNSMARLTKQVVMEVTTISNVDISHKHLQHKQHLLALEGTKDMDNSKVATMLPVVVMANNKVEDMVNRIRVSLVVMEDRAVVVVVMVAKAVAVVVDTKKVVEIVVVMGKVIMVVAMTGVMTGAAVAAVISQEEVLEVDSTVEVNQPVRMKP